MDIFKKKLILASKSPRRKQLLEQAGFSFSIQTTDVEESYSEEIPKEEVPVFLARKKAHASKHFIQEEEIILAADSVVLLGDEIFEKPKDFDDAFRILEALSGHLHRVITGVCLLSKTKESVFSGVSEVQFYPLTKEEINYYIETYQPYDKAGAYAIQEWIGYCKVSKINGTYSNIMGLPIDLVYKELESF